MSSTTATTFRVFERPPESTKYLENEHPQKISVTNSLPQEYTKTNTEILKMSKFPEKVHFLDNGFVRTVIRAYSNHHNLIIRPDDIWVAIMTQFSFYINKHAEEFRGKFVNFEGKKELLVQIPGTLKDAPYDLFVKLITKEIDKILVDPEVKEWIMPTFSTTTDNDLVCMGIVFMAAMYKYFDFTSRILCGIPNITLEGTVEDWLNIRRRLEKLQEYYLEESGSVLEKWHKILGPILDQFVNAKNGKVELDFWQKIADYSGGSGKSYISGWITYFCVFDENGNWQGKIPCCQDLKDLKEKTMLRIPTNRIPYGIVEVDVKIIDNDKEFISCFFGGHFGAELKDDGFTLQPTLGWVVAMNGEESNKNCKRKLQEEKTCQDLIDLREKVKRFCEDNNFELNKDD